MLERTLRRLALVGPIEDLLLEPRLFKRISDASPEETERMSESLLKLVEKSSSDVSLRAEQLLGCLNVEAIGVVASSLRKKEPLWRRRVISILWRLTGESTAEYMKRKGTEVLSCLVPLFQDTFVIKYSPEEDMRDEPEYQDLRICDEAYLLIAELNGTYTEEFFFVELNYGERDEAIREFASRMSRRRQGPVA